MQMPPIPMLGEAVASKVAGVYVVREKAVVGQLYQVTCPNCQHQLLVKAKAPKPCVERCKFCGAKMVIKGVQIETPTHLYEPDQQSTPPPSKPTEKVNVPMGKNIQVSAKLVWGSFFSRKSYVLREGENYIGRNDRDVPSDVNIDDDYVSRRSILIEVIKAPKGFTYKLTVKKCTNPVLINGQAQKEGNSMYLNYGDTILVGNTTLSFKPAN